MTSHALARYLLANTPDNPVIINGWGSDEGFDYEVTTAKICESGHIALSYDDPVAPMRPLPPTPA